MSKKQNQLIGWALLSLLFAGYVHVFTPPPKKNAQPKNDTVVSHQVVTPKDTSSMGQFKAKLTVDEAASKEVTLANEKMKVTLSTQGGYVKAIELLGYSSYDEYKKKGNHPLKLLTGSCFDFVIPTEQGTIHTKDCLFKQVKSDNPRQVTFVYEIPNQKEAYIRQTFSLKKTDYQVTCHIETTGIQLASETKAPLL